MTDLEKYIAECEANAIPDEEIDTSEIPPVLDFSTYEPRHCVQKTEKVSILFNSDLLKHLKSYGYGWQNRLNSFLMQAYANGQI